MACQPEGTKDRRTTHSAATMEPLESTTALTKAGLSITPDDESQAEEGHKPRGGPKSAEKLPASKSSDPEQERHKEAAWHSPELRTGQDGDAQIVSTTLGKRDHSVGRTWLG